MREDDDSGVAVCDTQLLPVSAGATAYDSTEPRSMYASVDTVQDKDNVSTSLIWSSPLPAFRRRLDPNVSDNILLYPAPSCSIEVMTSTPMPIPHESYNYATAPAAISPFLPNHVV